MDVGRLGSFGARTLGDVITLLTAAKASLCAYDKMNSLFDLSRSLNNDAT